MASREEGYYHYHAAPITLSVIAGALILAGALLPLIWYSMPVGMGGMMMQGMSMGMRMWQQSWPYLNSTVGIIAGSLIILGSMVMGNRPREARVWGMVILASSVVSLVNMGGFIVGPILGIVGGALALAGRG